MLDDRDYLRPAAPPRGGRWRLPAWPAVTVLVAVTIAGYVLQLLTRDFAFIAGGPPGLRSPPFGAAGGGWGHWLAGLLAYPFLHPENATVLLFNLLALYFLGKPVEAVIGARRFYALYGIAALGGAAVWLAFNRHGLTLPVRGAGGAISGLLVAAALLVPDLTMLLFFVLPVKVKWLALAALALLTLTLYRDAGAAGCLLNAGGAAGGFLATQLLCRRHLAFAWPALLRGWRPAGRAAPRPPRTAPRPYRPPDLTFVRDPPAAAGPAAADATADEMDRQIDPILDKIGKHGMKSLTTDERRLLDQARQRLRKGS